MLFSSTYPISVVTLLDVQYISYNYTFYVTVKQLHILLLLFIWWTLHLFILLFVRCYAFRFTFLMLRFIRFTTWFIIRWYTSWLKCFSGFTHFDIAFIRCYTSWFNVEAYSDHKAHHPTLRCIDRPNIDFLWTAVVP